MEIILSILKIILPLFLISISSYCIIRFFNIEDYLEKIILIFCFNCFQIVLAIEIFSIFRVVNYYSLLLFHVFVALVLLLLFYKKFITNNFIINFFNYFKNQNLFKNINKKIKLSFISFKIFFNQIKIVKAFKIIMILWLGVILLTTFIIGITIPPKNYDSMTYHLTRAAFWKQNQTINHYFTGNLRQLENPINAEVILLWIMIFTNSDYILFILQWMSLIIILIAVFKILRLLNIDIEISFLVSFLVATFDMIIFQASSTQNDLFLASFLAVSLYFVLKLFNLKDLKDLKEETIQVETLINNSKLKNDYLKNLYLKYSIFAGFSCSFTIGIKGYSYLFIAGFLTLLLIYLAWDIFKNKYKNDFSKNSNFFKNNFKFRFKKVGFLLLFFLIGLIFFASYNWVENFKSFGNIFSSVQTRNLMAVQNPNAKTFISNFIRHLFSFYQLNNVDRGTISLLLDKILNNLHGSLNLSISSKLTTWPDTQYYLSGLGYNMDVAYFGIIVFALCLPSVILICFLYLVIYFIKKSDAEFHKNIEINKINKLFKISLILSILPWSFFIIYVWLFKWQPWAGRLMIGFTVLLSLNLSFLFLFIKIINKKFFFNISLAIVLTLSVIFSGKVLFNSWDPKILPINGQTIYDYPYEQRRYVNAAPEMYEVYLKAENIYKKGARIGLFTHNDSWDYIFFGKNFNKELFYLSENLIKSKKFIDIIKEYNLDGVILYKNNLPFDSNEEFNNSIRGLKYIEVNGYCLVY